MFVELLSESLFLENISTVNPHWTTDHWSLLVLNGFHESCSTLSFIPSCPESKYEWMVLLSVFQAAVNKNVMQLHIDCDSIWHHYMWHFSTWYAACGPKVSEPKTFSCISGSANTELCQSICKMYRIPSSALFPGWSHLKQFFVNSVIHEVRVLCSVFLKKWA